MAISSQRNSVSRDVIFGLVKVLSDPQSLSYDLGFYRDMKILSTIWPVGNRLQPKSCKPGPDLRRTFYDPSSSVTALSAVPTAHNSIPRITKCNDNK